MTVRIRSRLRKNCLYEHVEWIESALTVWHAIHGSEILNRVGDVFIRLSGLLSLHQSLSSTLLITEATECEVMLPLRIRPNGFEYLLASESASSTMIDTLSEGLQ